jgi:flavin reductase (DIM6/NTAB) family NADH-FMN oxidoreductase RutF
MKEGMMGTREIAYTENLDHTLEVMARHGLLLSSAGQDGRPNVMTIGWGCPGIIWGKPMFVVLVRPSRFTFGNIEARGEFVVNVPADDMHETCLYCGTESGRDVDKFAERGLTALDAETVGAPLIEQCVRHYECRVVHRNDVVDAALEAEIRAGAYPQGDFHRLFYGEILRTSERA